MQQNSPVDGMRLTDVQFLPQPVQEQRAGEETTLVMPGQFQMLYYDMDGNLHVATQKWEEKLSVPTGEGAIVEAQLWPTDKPQGTLMSGSAQLNSELKLTTETRSNVGIPMVTGLELGEMYQPDPHRPSLILKKAGGKSLWEIAKQNGSTVMAITQANDLQTEPSDTQMLLIPVL